MLVLEHIEVTTHTCKRRTCLEFRTSRFIALVSLPYAGLDDGIVSVLDIQAQQGFVLSVRSKRTHGGANGIDPYSDTTEESCGVFLLLHS